MGLSAGLNSLLFIQNSCNMFPFKAEKLFGFYNQVETQDLLGEYSLPENWGLDNKDEKDQLRNSDLKALVFLYTCWFSPTGVTL